ncbi:MAG: hypothetical protein U9R20_01265, partial [Thermodesulfobacteriota bacterium]|nr:hypothetical protein [Thermodesulfobacteriota bacterium]
MKIGIMEAALMSRDTIKPRPAPTPRIPELRVMIASEMPRFPGVIFSKIEKLENTLIKKIVPKDKEESDSATNASQKERPFKRIFTSVYSASLTNRNRSFFMMVHPSMALFKDTVTQLLPGIFIV